MAYDFDTGSNPAGTVILAEEVRVQRNALTDILYLTTFTDSDIRADMPDRLSANIKAKWARTDPSSLLPYTMRLSNCPPVGSLDKVGCATLSHARVCAAGHHLHAALVHDICSHSHITCSYISCPRALCCSTQAHTMLPGTEQVIVAMITSLPNPDDADRAVRFTCPNKPASSAEPHCINPCNGRCSTCGVTVQPITHVQLCGEVAPVPPFRAHPLPFVFTHRAAQVCTGPCNQFHAMLAAACQSLHAAQP